MPASKRITLDPTDEFEEQLIQIALMHREKAEQYGSAEDALNNFYVAAVHLDCTPLLAAIAFQAKHEARLTKWLRDECPTDGAGVEDMFIDRAVYSVIQLVLWRRLKEATT
jgi:hypothetical protein